VTETVKTNHQRKKARRAPLVVQQRSLVDLIWKGVLGAILNKLLGYVWMQIFDGA